MTEFRPSRFEILPIVIKNLLIINGLFFLAQQTIGKGGFINMEAVLGLHHVKSPLFQPWQLITHLFLHGDILHIIYNMFALWMFGSILENVWGPKRFLTFYLLCGVGAGIIQLVSLWVQYHDLINQFMAIKNNPNAGNIVAFYEQYGLSHDPDSIGILQNYLATPESASATSGILRYISSFTYAVISNPTIGASGAVFGVLAAFIYLFPDTSIYLYFLFPIKAKWIGLFYFGSEIVSAFQNSPTDNVAHWAHLGGGLVGFLLVLTWNKTRKNYF